MRALIVVAMLSFGFSCGTCVYGADVTPPQHKAQQSAENKNDGAAPLQLAAPRATSTHVAITNAQQPPAKRTAHDDRHDKQNRLESFLFDIKITDVLLALFTGLLVVVTAKLVSYTKRLWTSTDSLVQGADETAKRQLRAYVACTDYGYNPVGDEKNVTGHRIRAIFTNDGITPARHVISHVGKIVSSTPIKDDHTFDYIDMPHPAITIIAPRSRSEEAVTFTSQQIIDSITEKSFLYVWGWVDYSDIFGGRNRTEVCRRVMVFPRADGKLDIHFGNHTTYNAMDEDCTHKPRPYVAK